MAKFSSTSFIASAIGAEVQSQQVAATRPLALNVGTDALTGTVIAFMGATLLGVPGTLAAGALLGAHKALTNRAAYMAGSVNASVKAAVVASSKVEE